MTFKETKKRSRKEFDSEFKKQAKKVKIDNICNICNKEISKYKCPICQIIKYCSIDCYKIHKEMKCEKPSNKIYDLNEPISLQSYTVKEWQYDKLRNNQRIKQALSNIDLQKIIKMVDQSKKPEKLLENLISKDERFAEFVDYMLTVIQFRDKNLSQQNNKNNKFLTPNEKLEIILKDEFNIQ